MCLMFAYIHCRYAFLATAVAILAMTKMGEAMPKMDETDSLGACNEFDQPLDFQCPTGYSIDHISGYHNSDYEDRVYCYSCQKVSVNYTDCYDTGYVNDWGQPVVTVCKSNQYYIAGVDSYHSNPNEDRRFNYKCCSSSQFCTKNCFTVGPVNNYDGNMAYSVKGSNVIVGAFSIHEDEPE